MHVVNNLDREKSIEEQIESLAVATNLMYPKQEDFHYKYSECDEWQRGVLLGMAIAADQIDTLWANKEVLEGNNEPGVVQQVREDYQEQALTEAQDWIIMHMCEMLISFGDDNACKEE